MQIRFALPISLACALTLSACTDPSMIGSENRTRDGAILGGALGAMAGILSSDDNAKGAAIGGAIGAGIGGVIGNQLDAQAADLESSLNSDGIEIVNTGDRLIVTMPDDLLFEVDSAVVRPDLRVELRALADSLIKFPDTTVDVIGHTDNTGAASYNQELSARRASSVTAVLIDSGVTSSRLRSYGVGEDQPVASNLTPEGRAQNRRVEIVIRPNA
ncbi:MAG: OmpA family protein [Oceanicola sp.]|nr:OmpA family protein [Oceanicola sp.]